MRYKSNTRTSTACLYSCRSFREVRCFTIKKYGGAADVRVLVCKISRDQYTDLNNNAPKRPACKARIAFVLIIRMKCAHAHYHNGDLNGVILISPVS